MAETKCKICGLFVNSDGDAHESVKLTQKGADGINRSSKDRNDDIQAGAGDFVHITCRQRYVNKKNIALSVSKKGNPVQPIQSLKRPRISGPQQKKCLFCDKEVVFVENNNPVDGSAVMTHGKKSFTSTILAKAKERADDWGTEIAGKIGYFMNDLRAFDIVYHQQCSVNFRTFRFVPKQFQNEGESKGRKIGRPIKANLDEAFRSVCNYFEENDDEQLTVHDLVNKMSEFLTDTEPFTAKWMKEKLMEHYGSDVHITSHAGKVDIITMTEKQDRILREFFESSKDMTDDEKKRSIIEAAARLMKSDIKASVPSQSDDYPSTEDIKSGVTYLPDSVKYFLDHLFVGKSTERKIASIGQAIVQASRPVAVMAPLQLGLGVQVHHLTRSKAIVEVLHAMGFSVSYKEVLRYETNAASSQLDCLLGNESDGEGALLLAADNVDHNIRTIDGKNTFHGMGMICAFTPKRRSARNVPRDGKASMIERTKIPVLNYEDNSICQTKFEALPILTHATNKLDDLWRLSVRFHDPSPNWSGMMTIFHQHEQHPGVSSVHFLPMIDLAPGDMSCIYSTLIFLSRFARIQRLPAIITFDQPLYLKAAEIIEKTPTDDDLKDIVLLLGTFHTAMNLIGAIGYLMEGSGLREILQTVYGVNAVDHIFTGKSFSRAFRAHQLVDRALMFGIMEKISDVMFAELLNSCEVDFSVFLDGGMDLNDIQIDTLLDMVNEERDRLKESSLTSKLWIEYMDMLRTLRDLIGADRSGNWIKHLSTLRACLPIFAASGHYHYLKSAHFYLQKMADLQRTNPTAYRLLKNGFHVIRRTNKYWAGLGSDLTIEQTLMRTMKCAKGLTRGSGMTEEMRAVWTTSVPVCADLNLSMQEFLGLVFTTSEQHKELGKARSGRDNTDLQKLIEKMKSYSPFFEHHGRELRNIITGIEAHRDVNVTEWQKIGNDTISNMVDEGAFTYSYSRQNKVRNLASVCKVKTTEGTSIDPALLFQRFLIVVNNGDLTYDEVMGYELCTYPPSLFESPSSLREADKPSLATAIANYGRPGPSTKQRTEAYVLDGGSLLRRVQWTQGSTYGEISESYAISVERRYGKRATVIFDGYEDGPTIKDSTHERRRHGRVISVVSVTPDSHFSGKRDEFLSLGPQKHKLILLIRDAMEKRGIKTLQANGDADVLISKTAVLMSKTVSVSLIGEDTDLLVLALYYSHIEKGLTEWQKLYFWSDKASCKSIYDIHDLAQTLGSMSAELPFLHAMTGCDSTSRIHGIGKASGFKKLCSQSSKLHECAKIFSIPNQSDETITEAGELAMCCLFDSNSKTDINQLRSQILRSKLVKAKSFVTPEKLPPTYSSTKYHSLRVYYQTLVFIGKDQQVKPVEWGWKLEDGKLLPVAMDAPPAPEALLKIIHCTCRTGCETIRCGCKKLGFECSSACGECQNGNCQNIQRVDCNESDEE